ncbi:MULTISPECIES: hypothetical protein [unclassified Xanthomonas]|uniref:hypothetical protein n=1 Tax=unclassified Xanthomonas TaxID=2643310 RepID=UPI0021E0934D|nr:MULTISPECIES: hypothetical protein [unclassified Xanthomonas]UYC22474.1 hypothetical protein NUG20_09405 [Xanthomonas sp. CFBP 8443]
MMASFSWLIPDAAGAMRATPSTTPHAKKSGQSCAKFFEAGGVAERGRFARRSRTRMPRASHSLRVRRQCELMRLINACKRNGGAIAFSPTARRVSAAVGGLRPRSHVVGRGGYRSLVATGVAPQRAARHAVGWMGSTDIAAAPPFGMRMV